MDKIYFAFIVILLIAIACVYYLTSNQLIWGGFGDPEQFIWQAFNWISFFRTSEVVVDSIFLGIPTPMSYTPTVFLQSLVFLAYYHLSSNYVFSYNATIFTLLLSNFFIWFWFFRNFTITPKFSLLGALLIALCPAVIIHSLGHMGIFINFQFAILLYGLFKLKNNPSQIINWAIVGFALGASFWAHEYWGVASLIIAGIFGVFNYSRWFNKYYFMNALILAEAFILTALPIIAVYLGKMGFENLSGIQTERSSLEASLYSSQPSNYFQRNLLNSESFNYLGLVVIIIGLALLVNSIKRKELRLNELSVSALSFILLSFGTQVHIFGLNLHLPLALLYKLDAPFVTQIRAWGRYGIIAYIFIVCLIVLKINQKRLLKIHNRSLGFISMVIMLVMILDQVPFASVGAHALNIPEFLTVIRTDNRDGIVLHLPLSTHLGALHNSRSMVWQTYHGKRIVGGYTSFDNPIFRDQLLSSELIGVELGTLMSSKSGSILANCENLQSVILKNNISYIIWEKKSDYHIPDRFSPADENIVNTKIQEILSCYPEEKRVFDDNHYQLIRI